MDDTRVMTLRGDRELMARAGHLFGSVRTEFVCAARDLRTWQLAQLRTAVRDSRDTTGAEVRKLLTPVALTDESAREHLRDVLARGARVRISEAPLPQETIIIDRRIAILAGGETPGGREFSVVRSPGLVSGVRALFETAWSGAVDLDAYYAAERPQLDDEARTILRALGSGRTDEVAARELGTSLRTYRRRVAELLDALGAGSRFQAGLRAGALGL